MFSYFDRIVCISLPRRADRRAYLAKEIHLARWPFAPVQVVDAIDATGMPRPAGFPTRGSYGCLLSHISVLEKAVADGVKRLLVLEDDCCFCPGFAEKAEEFLRQVPEDWECLMLGGQLFGAKRAMDIEGQRIEKYDAERLPVEGRPAVHRVTGACRTHCYALQGPAIASMLAVWRAYRGHCDHAFSAWQKSHATYAPAPHFIAGQMGGQSDNYADQCNLRTAYWNAGREYDRDPAEHKRALDAVELPAEITAALLRESSVANA